MELKKSIAAFSLIGLSFSANAFSETTIMEIQPEASSSKRIGVAGGVGLLGGIAMAGVEGSYEILNGLDVGVQLSSGGIDYGSTFDDGDVEFSAAKVNVSQYSGFARYKPMGTDSSFTLKGALGVRSFDFEFSAENVNAPSVDYARAKSNGTVGLAELDIGNYWVWDSGLMVGVDWIGISAALGGEIEDDNDFGIRGSSSSKDEAEDSSKALSDLLGKEVVAKLLHAKIGYRF